MMNLLFICSRNQWRSPTAETIWRNSANYQTRSAGTSASARRSINRSDIQWADVIIVMEDCHKERLKSKFSYDLIGKSLHTLNIPDEYGYMDGELVAELKLSVGPILDNE